MSLLMLGVVVIGFTGFAVAEYFMATWSIVEKATYMWELQSQWLASVAWNPGHINTPPRSRSRARSTPGNGPLCGVLFKIYQWVCREPSTF